MEHILSSISTADYQLSLTFDDGPDPIYTPLILNILKRFNSKATFFVVGRQVEQYPELAIRIVAEGHELGNHTYSHPNLTKLNDKQVYDELIKTENIIKLITGQKPALFRPPYLKYNKNTIEIYRKLNYYMILKSIDTFDYRQPGVHKIAKRVINNINKGEIVLFHDSGGDRMQTVAALEIILNSPKINGYECVCVSKLLSNTAEQQP